MPSDPLTDGVLVVACDVPVGFPLMLLRWRSTLTTRLLPYVAGVRDLQLAGGRVHPRRAADRWLRPHRFSAW